MKSTELWNVDRPTVHGRPWLGCFSVDNHESHLSHYSQGSVDVAQMTNSLGVSYRVADCRCPSPSITLSAATCK